MRFLGESVGKTRGFAQFLLQCRLVLRFGLIDLALLGQLECFLVALSFLFHKVLLLFLTLGQSVVIVVIVGDHCCCVWVLGVG